MMVLDYYRLQEQPFGGTPDPRFLFLNSTYQEALNSLVYSIEAGCGFVALIATPGLGKTTLLFEVLNLLRDKARTVFLFQTISTPLDLLRTLLSGLGVRDLQGGLVELQLKLKDLLTEQYRLGKRVVLVIDEAQNLDDSVLELVRMLSNFETPRDKLIQVILSGQPQLAENIGSPELLQLRQRVSKFARLEPLSAEDTTLYIAHRLRTAGYPFDMPLFTRDALALIVKSSGGIPRNINNLCFNALSLGCAKHCKLIDRDLIREVITDLDLGAWRKKGPVVLEPEGPSALQAPAIFSAASTPSFFSGWLPKATAVLALFLILGAGLFASRRWLPHPGPTQPTQTVLVQPRPQTTMQPKSEEATLAPTPYASPQPAPAPAAPPAFPLPIPSPGALSSAIALQTRQPEDAAGAVFVAPGQTLLGICVEKFGSCTPEIMQQIHDLNPSLSNLDHIETGQRIRIPVLAAQSRAMEQPRATSADKGAHE